jgi:hypothetical protein
MARRKSDIVVIECYGQIETMERQKAIEKYYEGMVCCEGSERDRYVTIYEKLMNGEKICSDTD